MCNVWCCFKQSIKLLLNHVIFIFGNLEHQNDRIDTILCYRNAECVAFHTHLFWMTCMLSLSLSCFIVGITIIIFQLYIHCWFFIQTFSQFQWNGWLTYWPTDLPTIQPTDQPTNRPTHWLTDLPNQSDSPTGLLID